MYVICGQKQLLWLKPCPNTETSWEQVHTSHKNEAISSDTSLVKWLSAPAPLARSSGEYDVLPCWELDSGSCLAGAGSTARHAMSWEGATYPTSAGLSAALLALQRSTTALDGTVTSWVCRSGGKKGIINIENTPGISPHPSQPSMFLWYSSRVLAKHENKRSPEGLKTPSYNHSQPCSAEGCIYAVLLINKFWVLLG